MKNCSLGGQPGFGDKFLKWVFYHQASPDHCELVEIHPRDGSEDDFVEFPDDPALARFDRSDRKFAAVARASQYNPAVLNATDSHWWIHRDALGRHGIVIEFLCHEQFGSK
jgi:hypothetical protein